ncbi:MAG: sulfatase/phosphatase domain-containing protein [Pirellulaceae bacterium]|nr:DUF4976 domain-containing protein [Planctomycetota bacterium]
MVDDYPTLAELAGLKVPTYIAGVSLVPTLKDVTARPRSAAFTQYNSGYSVRTERYRYTEWGEKGADGNELYDHASDAAEMQNLAGSAKHRNIVAELSRLLHARIAESQTASVGVKQNNVQITRRVAQPRLLGTYRGRDDGKR